MKDIRILPVSNVNRNIFYIDYDAYTQTLLSGTDKIHQLNNYITSLRKRNKRKCKISNLYY